ncbi:MAG TPA: NAD-dependent epimerase/dehydratase family protein [Flavitalea sp.]|nr:NAD-dependent epimerase/dehydratase family protein [Flavitalea sp.]
MKTLITGASGYLGNQLAHALADSGSEVVALVRSDAAKALLQHPNITIFPGDVVDRGSLTRAMKGCSQVYHMAAKVGAWGKDVSSFYRVNVEGTGNVLESALETGIEKVVFTSTSGVIGPSDNGPLTENSPRTVDFNIDYDLSKKKAEDVVLQYTDKLKAVIVNPVKIYGPGKVSHSLSANAIIDSFLKNKVALIPGPGTYKVCFAFIDDVVNGHIQAMQHGRSGERYILGGVNISYYDFFDKIRQISGGKGRIVKMPKSVIKTWAAMQELNHRLFGLPVRFTVKSVELLFSNYIFSSHKAINDLGYSITPLDEAVSKTISFLKHKHHG